MDLVDLICWIALIAALISLGVMWFKTERIGEENRVSSVEANPDTLPGIGVVAAPAPIADTVALPNPVTTAESSVAG